MNVVGFAALILIGAVGACAEPPGAMDRASTAPENAGLHLVESRDPLWTEGTRWRVDQQPTLQIGEAADGPSERQFGNIVGVHRLPNGHIGVVDSWAPAVIFFDSAGRFLGRVGRFGSGPGEFPRRARMSSLACGSDTVYVVVQQRISAFTSPNQHVRTFPLDGQVRIRTCTSERFVGVLEHTGWRKSAGVFTDSVLLAWYSRDGSMLSVIDSLPDQETDWTRSAEGFGYSRLLFGRVLSVVGQGSSLASGFGDSFQIDLRDTTGAITRVVRVAGLDRSVATGDIEAFRGFVFNPWRGNKAERIHLESRLAEARGRPLPAFAELRFDRAGNIWARLYDHLDAVAFFDYSSLSSTFTRPAFDEARRWAVLRSDGRYLGEIRTPARFSLHEIGEDWILGVWRDEFDIQFARKYPLIKPAQ